MEWKKHSSGDNSMDGNWVRYEKGGITIRITETTLKISSKEIIENEITILKLSFPLFKVYNIKKSLKNKEQSFAIAEEIIKLLNI
jgi:hypothetical protein